MRRLFIVACAILGLTTAPSASQAETAYDHAFTAIDGTPLPLEQYRGKALLVVNTASLCGFTRQYGDLQQVAQTYADQGLIVIGVPSNDFRQEFSDADQVKNFCETNFDVSFPLTDITSVRGPAAHPFFAWAAARSAPPRWNFTKYVVGRDGQLAARFGSMPRPTSPQVTAAIEAALAP